MVGVAYTGFGVRSVGIGDLGTTIQALRTEEFNARFTFANWLGCIAGGQFCRLFGDCQPADHGDYTKRHWCRAVLPIATSASSQLPQPAGTGTQGALVDEAYAYTTRTHEWTAAVTDTTTFLLSTTTGNTNGAPVATQSVRPFPSYLNGLEYAQFDNASRSITDFSVNMTFAQAVKAYLFIDNRTGLASGTKANTTDPDLTGPLAWVTTNGWTRVNTGIMPNGQADYLGIDEGATVASAGLTDSRSQRKRGRIGFWRQQLCRDLHQEFSGWR